MAAFSVVTNIGALKAHNQLVSTERNLNVTLNRLSSGLRINGAADDAAGLAIAENLRADVQGLNQAVRNANDGLSVINVADSALNEISNMLQRAMTLAEQAASDTSGQDSSSSKSAINDEYNQILSEIDRIASTVSFNGINLLSSGGATIDVQVGLSSSTNDRITVTTSAISAASLGLASDQLLTKSDARNELVALQSAIDTVSSDRGDLGASYNRLTNTIAVITVQAENLMAAESQIRDANIAQEVVNMTKYQVLTQSGLAALGQANNSSQNVLSLLQ
ncbi:MAG: flagellin [Acidobacteriota bacterium]|nr:flagellin [Acidobacteriota bacterium]MDQ7087438.1 flagellin [Acidobacteriota bacterium]